MSIYSLITRDNYRIARSIHRPNSVRNRFSNCDVTFETSTVEKFTVTPRRWVIIIKLEERNAVFAYPAAEFFRRTRNLKKKNMAFFGFIGVISAPNAVNRAVGKYAIASAAAASRDLAERCPRTDTTFRLRDRRGCVRFSYAITMLQYQNVVVMFYRYVVMLSPFPGRRKLYRSRPLCTVFYRRETTKITVFRTISSVTNVFYPTGDRSLRVRTLRFYNSVCE